MTKQNKMSLFLGVMVLFILVITSTYAFFQLTSDETGNSASSFTGELEDIENYGNSFLRGGLTGYHIKVNASDMAPSKVGTHYYGTTDENSDYNLKRMNYEVSEVSIEGGTNNDNIEYTCTSELSITLNGSLTEGDVLQEEDGALYLSGNNIRLDERKIDLKDLIEEASKNETKEYKKKLTYIISKGNNGTLNVDFEIVNRNAIQNDIAGKKIDITIKNSNLQCEVSGKKVYMTALSTEPEDCSSNLECIQKGLIIGEKQLEIEKVEFVDRVPSNEELKNLTYWDFSDTTKSAENSVIGWIEKSGNKGYKFDIENYEFTEEEIDLYNLYIGSKDSIYAKDLNNAFYSMTNLKEINFYNLNTSETTNMSFMFYGDSNLTLLDLSNFDTSSVTDMSEMFDSYQGTTLNLSAFDTSSVTNMSFMFAGVTVDLPFKDWSNFVTNNVENMMGMFSYYQGTSLDLNTFDTSKVTNMSYMFSDCYNLTTLDLSTFDTSSVTNMSGMFNYVTAELSFKDWPNFITSNVEDMSQMFYRCSKLTTLDLSTFDTSKVTNMKEMFYDCSNLTTLDLSNFTFDNVTTEGGTRAGNYETFYNVPSDCQVKINKSQLGTFNKLFPLGTGTYDRKFRLPGEE